MSWVESLFNGFSDSMSDMLSNMSFEGLFNKFISWLYEAVFGGISELLTKLNSMGAEIFDLQWCKLFMQFFARFGGIMFVIGLILSFYELAIAVQSGQEDKSIKDTIINNMKGFIATYCFVNVPVELYRLAISFQNSFSGGIIAITGAENWTGSLGSYADSTLANWYNSTIGAEAQIIGLYSLCLLIAFCYCIIKVFFANLKRGGILLTLIAVGSLHMISVPRGYSDGFTGWCKQVVGICLTAFMQTSLLFAGLITFSSTPLLGIGVMLAATEVPRIAEKFGLETSMKANPMQALYATSMVSNIVRSVAH